MMRGLNSAICVMTITAFITLSLSSVWADNLPRAVGQCSTLLLNKSALVCLEGMPDSGSAVSYANGGYQVSYDTLPAIHKSHRGDQAGTEKMSEVILRFAEPLKDDDGIVSKVMIEMAIIIWNASFMPRDMQRKALEDIINVLPRDAREARREMLLIVHMLLERKKKYFSNNKRLIMDYHITESAHSIHLDVVSTIPEGYHQER